ncbi:MAG: glutamate mutase L [Chloroflexota bacterium]
MAETTRVSSILTADFGSAHTRVVLVDIIDGTYQIVTHEMGRTTLGYPDDDLGIGLERLLENITNLTGREFYNAEAHVKTPESRDGSGVDYFVTTASAGRPLRAIVVGLVPEVSIDSAMRAISGTYVELLAQFHLRDGLSDEDRLNRILIGRPDLIFIAGGTDNGATQALENMFDIIAVALKMTARTDRPPIVYAGNTALQSVVTDTFGELTDLLISDNIRPKVNQEQFESVNINLGQVYDRHREAIGDAFTDVGDMSSTGLLPTAQSYGVVAEYYAQTSGGNVLAVDMGSTTSVLVGVFGGKTTTRISTTKGLGHSASTLIDDVGEDAIAQWLPFYPEAGEIRNYALNKLARPASIPMSLRHMYLEQAMMRTALRQMVTESRTLWNGVAPAGKLPPIGTIIVGGSPLNGTGDYAYNLLLLAECLQPTGVTQVKVDDTGIIPALSAIARREPTAGVQLLDGNALHHIGTLLSIEGDMRRDRDIAKLTISAEGDSQSIPLKAGKVYPVALDDYNVDVSLTIRCKTGYSIGGKSKVTIEVAGDRSELLLIDVRGRNLVPPATVEDRMRLLPAWVSGATFEEPVALPEEWALSPEATSSLMDDGIEDNSPAATSNESMDQIYGAMDDDEALDNVFTQEGDGRTDDIFSSLLEDDDDDDDDFDSLRNI